MIDKINQQTNNTELFSKKTDAVKSQPVANAPKSSVASSSNTPRSAASLSAAFGLPQDKLSSSVISFARVFSLPLKPQLLADLRRHALPPPASNTSQNTNQSSATATATEAPNPSFATEKTRQALSLSAAAVESKEVELTPKGLESYSQAVDPDSRRQDDDRQRRRHNREQDEQEEKNSFKTESAKKPQYGEVSSPQLTADSLKKMFLEKEKQTPLLEVLNRLPCKNGQHWIVLPFDFEEADKNYNVSMRILLDDKRSSNPAVCMALDILETAEATPDKRWLFVTESANDKPMRLSVYFQDELSQKAHSKLKSELATLFNIPLEHINIKNMTEPFPYESSFAENFSSIDEAV
ncbi:hypothetical protein [Treponema sp. R6D11]